MLLRKGQRSLPMSRPFVIWRLMRPLGDWRPHVGPSGSCTIGEKQLEASAWHHLAGFHLDADAYSHLLSFQQAWGLIEGSLDTS